MLLWTCFDPSSGPLEVSFFGLLAFATRLLLHLPAIIPNWLWDAIVYWKVLDIIQLGDSWLWLEDVCALRGLVCYN